MFYKELKMLPDYEQKRYIFFFIHQFHFWKLRRGMDMIDGSLVIRPKATVDEHLLNYFASISPITMPEVSWLAELWHYL